MLSLAQTTCWSTITGLRSITFVTPHQDMASGGPYAIQQLAVHLGRATRVNLVVMEVEPRPVEWVHIFHSPELRANEIPDADAIVIHADARCGEEFASLPPSKGRRFTYFQGYGTPHSPVVIENLRRGFPVVASARWLAEEASRHGSPAIFVPYGFDSSIFHARGSFRRMNMVAMMANAVPWKGLTDGIEALRQVRAVLSDVEIVLFGIDDPGFEGATFVNRPAREYVADIMRESAVYVCPSWEEGFGMPGLEAMACGAALATTDTKGSRDYAVDGRTALVSTPKDPIALGRNIVALLTDTQLRNRIAATGQRRAMEYPEWPKAALLFLRALVTLRSRR